MTLEESANIRVGDVVSLGGKGGNFVVAGIEPYQDKIRFVIRSGSLNTICDHTKIQEVLKTDK